MKHNSIEWSATDSQNSLSRALGKANQHIAELERQLATQKKVEAELQNMTRRLAEAKADLLRCQERFAALQWQPIMPDNLPKHGDEVLYKTGMGVVTYVTVADEPMTADEWDKEGYIFRRPINPPAQEAVHEASPHD